MTTVSSRTIRTRRQVWRLSLALLLPIVVLMGLAAKASSTLQHPAAYEAPAAGR
jgi:hypothetical protein